MVSVYAHYQTGSGKMAFFCQAGRNGTLKNDSNYYILYYFLNATVPVPVIQTEQAAGRDNICIEEIVR